MCRARPADDASVDEAFLRERWLSSFPRTLAFLATLTVLNAFGQAHWFLRMSGRDQRRARVLFGQVFLVVFLLRGVAFAFAHEQTELAYGLSYGAIAGFRFFWNVSLPLVLPSLYRALALMTTILKYLDLERILILKWTTPERNNRNPYNRTLNKL